VLQRLVQDRARPTLAKTPLDAVGSALHAAPLGATPIEDDLDVRRIEEVLGQVRLQARVLPRDDEQVSRHRKTVGEHLTATRRARKAAIPPLPDFHG
jgi:hypothetical protein